MARIAVETKFYRDHRTPKLSSVMGSDIHPTPESARASVDELISTMEARIRRELEREGSGLVRPPRWRIAVEASVDVLPAEYADLFDGDAPSAVTAIEIADQVGVEA